MTNKKKMERFRYAYQTNSKEDIMNNLTEIPEEQVDAFLKQDWEKLNREVSKN